MSENNKFLGQSGISYLWNKIKANFLQKNEAYTKEEVNTLVENAFGAISGDFVEQSEFDAHKSASNPHNISKSTIGLGNVDNTADANKSVSHAQTSGVANRAQSISAEPTTTGYTIDEYGNFKAGSSAEIWHLYKNSGTSIFDVNWINGNVTTAGSVTAPSFIGNASTATKATQDGSGNTIATTYATKTELGGKSDAGHTHSAYAASSHSHSEYATTGHTHDSYAASNHNHDSVYAPKSHTHDYAASNHNHDSVYYAKSSGTSLETRTQALEDWRATFGGLTFTKQSNGSVTITVV